jgi:membrane protein
MKHPLAHFVGRLYRAYLGFSEHDDSLVAAGIAYYVALSFFPLMLVLVASVGFILKGTVWGQNARQQVFDAIGQYMSPDLAEQVKLALDAVSTNASTSGAIGFLVLLATAVAIFAQVDYAFDRIWRIDGAPAETWLQWGLRLVITRFKALVMLMGVGAFLVAAMIVSVVWATAQRGLAALSVEPWFAWATGVTFNIGLNYAALTIAYRYVPKARVHWRDALAAGLVASPLWEVGRQLLSLYLLRLNYPTAYGIIGSFLAIMLWAYYAMLVVLFGAEYVRVLQHERTESRELEF